MAMYANHTYTLASTNAFSGIDNNICSTLSRVCAQLVGDRWCLLCCSIDISMQSMVMNDDGLLRMKDEDKPDSGDIILEWTWGRVQADASALRLAAKQMPSK